MQASGRVAKDAARHSDGLYRAMVRGTMDEMQTQGGRHPGEVGLHAVTDEDDAKAQALDLFPVHLRHERGVHKGMVLLALHDVRVTANIVDMLP